MTLESGAKFEEKLTFGLENNIKNLANFHQNTRKPQNWDSKYLSLNFTGELCVMRMKNDAKIEEEVTSQFKIGMSNLMNFNSSTQKFAV